MVVYENILQAYDAMSLKSGQMVEAAQQGDWDRLAALEQDCSVLVAALKRADGHYPPPDAGFPQRKIALMRKVLADDAEVRRHTEPWMTRLQAYLCSPHDSQGLRHAYGCTCSS